jgi:hypothetical protein
LSLRVRETRDDCLGLHRMGKRSDGVRRVFRHSARAHRRFHSDLKKPVGNTLGFRFLLTQSDPRQFRICKERKWSQLLIQCHRRGSLDHILRRLASQVTGAEEAFSIPLYAGFCFLWSEYALADSGESDALATSCLSK